MSPVKGNNTGDNDPGKGGPGYTPWLLVHYEFPGDSGARPLAPGTVFWESPDVWSEGSLGKNQPVVGEPTQVYGQVTNLGAETAVGAIIKYWWANPSLAITEATANLIGTATGLTIPSMNMIPFPCPTDWTPVEQNGGHECLLIEAFLPVFDPLTDPMQPVYDRHVGQKNESLVTLPAGQSMHFQLDAFNFSQHPQEIAIEATRGVMSHALNARLEAAPYTPGHGEVVPNLQVAAKATRHVGHASKSANRLLSRPAEGAHRLGTPLASITRVFEPGEIRTVEVTGKLPPNARPGEIYPLRIFQRVGDTVVGGYTIYLTPAQ